MLLRLVSLLLAFLLGFFSCAGALIGGTYFALKEFKVRDIEKYGIADIPEEMFMGENYEVDLLNLSVLDYVEEVKTLQSLGNDVTIDFLISRYDLKIPSKVYNILSKEARQLPIRQLFSEKGMHDLLKKVYIGYAQGYECHALDSNESADPALGKGNARWYDPKTEKYISGINETIAFFNLDDFASGGIHVDSILHGIVLADVLGYTSETDDNGNVHWYDGNGDKVTGIMAVFADCSLDTVDERINTAHIGDLIGYEKIDGVWYDTNPETGNLEPISGFMSKIAESSISGDQNIGKVFDSLTIADIVNEEDRQGGIFSIIPAETEITDIGGVVNDSITNSPMQFFMNQGMIAFEEEQQMSLDRICALRNEYKVYAADDEDFVKYFSAEGMNWETDADGNYLVPAWRTKALNQSFSYIVALLTAPITPSIPEGPVDPSIPGDIIE